MIRKYLPLIFISFLLVGCSSIVTNTEFYNPILRNIETGNFDLAANQINDAELKGEYTEKDRVLLHLDKGMIFHYQGEYSKSNVEFEKAENLIEDLYTKSISKAATSMLLNDNALDYFGNVYEDLYINIFKAINYLHIGSFDDAYVEVKRVNDKLNLLDTKYDKYISELNDSKDSKIKIEAQELDYYNNVLANYISYLIFKTEGEDDNSRISLYKLNQAWDTYGDVYNYSKPSFLSDSTLLKSKNTHLNILAFVGSAPIKEAIGARITTFDNFVMVSDPTNFRVNAIPLPGIKYGWNFKFAFPSLVQKKSLVKNIEVYIDSSYYCNLELLENMANVARKTFESQKSITYFKSISRAVLKGIGASALGREIKKNQNEAVGNILTALTNVLVDATENADLRSWRTMPSNCYAAEIPLKKGIYNVEIRFLDSNGEILMKQFNTNVKIGKDINLLETFYLN